MTLILKLAFPLMSVILLSMVYYLGRAQIMEGYNIFDPYIDTEFAKYYTPEKFDRIDITYSRERVLKELGLPLFDFYDSVNRSHEYAYTNDSYLKKSREKRYSTNDFAWYRSSVKFDSNGKITRIDKGWSFD